MFRRRSSLKRAIENAADPELQALEEEILRRQERIAQLELELFDHRAAIADFEEELERRVRPLERYLERLEARLVKERRLAARRAQWGDRAEDEDVPDVVEQFEKAWTPREPRPSKPRQEGTPEVDPADLKRLYRNLAKRFHPDLTTDPEEKTWRKGVMAEVNAAYAKGDLVALRALQEKADRPEPEKAKSREQLIIDMRAEIARLNSVIRKLESDLDRLARSEELKLQLDASMARRQGRDLLGEMASQLQVRIAEVESELEALR